MTDMITVPREEWERVKATGEAALILAVGLLFDNKRTLEDAELRAVHHRLLPLMESPLPMSAVAEKALEFVRVTRPAEPTGLFDQDDE